MGGFFRRSKRELAENEGVPDAAERHALDEYAAYVPASVRVPETQRFTPLETDDDAPDEDLDFLSSLAGEIDRARPSVKKRDDLSVNQKMIDRKPDTLEIFRDFAPDLEDRTTIRDFITIPDVEMSDVLEDLATVAAALRLRKAA